MMRYMYGWLMFARAFHMARTKKRGAGRQSWTNAYRTAACYRWIVDGQMRGGKFPGYLQDRRTR